MRRSAELRRAAGRRPLLYAADRVKGCRPAYRGDGGIAGLPGGLIWVELTPPDPEIANGGNR